MSDMLTPEVEEWILRVGKLLGNWNVEEECIIGMVLATCPRKLYRAGFPRTGYNTGQIIINQ